jgi:hypothetical protein
MVSFIPDSRIIIPFRTGRGQRNAMKLLKRPVAGSAPAWKKEGQ